jgi:hypothetical protein
MFGLAGCTDQRDLYVLSGPVLEVEGDWMPSLGVADMTMNATAVAFDSEGGAVKEYFYSPDKVEIPVTESTYDVLLFNGLMYSPDDTHLDGLKFRGTDRLETFEVMTKEGSLNSRLGSRSQDEYIASNDMEIVTSALQSQVVDESRSYYMKYKDGENGLETPEDYVYAQMQMTPVPLSYEAQVVVTIKNISSAAGASAALYGFVGSAFMASRLPSHFYVTHHFNLNSRKWIDQDNDTGTIESPRFVTFGPPLDVPDNKYEVYIKMILVNGEEHEWTFDVTEQMQPIIEEIKANFESGATIHYQLEIPLELYLELPVVEPVEGSVGVGNWSDDELITVPITP